MAERSFKPAFHTITLFRNPAPRNRFSRGLTFQRGANAEAHRLALRPQDLRHLQEGRKHRAGSAVAETVDAKTTRYNAAAALVLLLDGIDRIVSAKGKRIDVLKLKDKPTDEAILARLIGPTGNLRAPTARVGRTLLVGFNAEADGRVLQRE